MVKEWEGIEYKMKGSDEEKYKLGKFRVTLDLISVLGFILGLNSYFSQSKSYGSC